MVGHLIYRFIFLPSTPHLPQHTPHSPLLLPPPTGVPHPPHPPFPFPPPSGVPHPPHPPFAFPPPTGVPHPSHSPFPLPPPAGVPRTFSSSYSCSSTQGFFQPRHPFPLTSVTSSFLSKPSNRRLPLVHPLHSHPSFPVPPPTLLPISSSFFTNLRHLLLLV